MLKVFPLLFFLLTPSLEAKGSILRINGRGFSFSITEPEGWSVDFHSAAQIANFVMHPESSTWREASVVVFGRFIRKRPRETLEGFLHNALEEFQNACPFYDIQPADLQVRGAQEFLTRSLHCPGVRHEIVATTEVPGFFVTFVLSASQQDELHKAQPPFEDLLSSFVWLSHSSVNRIPPAKNE